MHPEVLWATCFWKCVLINSSHCLVFSQILIPMLETYYESEQKEQQKVEHYPMQTLEANHSSLAIFTMATRCVWCLQLPTLETVHTSWGTLAFSRCRTMHQTFESNIWSTFGVNVGYTWDQYWRYRQRLQNVTNFSC